MGLPLVALAVAGVWGVGWAMKETGETLDSASKLTKWGIVAGGLYVSYTALKSTGAIK